LTQPQSPGFAPPVRLFSIISPTPDVRFRGQSGRGAEAAECPLLTHSVTSPP
jgi:hypothetical protein